MSITPNIAAIHESAHVVIAAKLGLRLRSVAINDNGGGLTQVATPIVAGESSWWAELQIVTSMAGAAAEVVLLGRARDQIGDTGDRANQQRYAQSLAPSRQQDWQARCWRCACGYVREYANEIAALADELVTARQLSGVVLDRQIRAAAS